MLKQLRLDHRFVRHIPDVELGILYVSMDYATASHLCCCGCGEEVVTPFTPAQWKMTFDGETVSLHPSVGNWMLKCRSHYVVSKARVLEAEPWPDAQIAIGLAKDKSARGDMYDKVDLSAVAIPKIKDLKSSKNSLWRVFKAWVSGS